MADLSKMTPLERAFHQDCLNGSETLKRELNYNPTLFLRMVHEHGGVEATRRLLKASNFQDGLFKLWQNRRLDLSVEAAVVQPKWASLFTEAEKAAARKRLKDMKYDPFTNRYEETPG